MGMRQKSDCISSTVHNWHFEEHGAVMAKPKKTQINPMMPIPTSPIAGSGGIVDPTRFGQILTPDVSTSGIVQNIPRKQGKIQPHPWSNEITASIFPYAGVVTQAFHQPGTVGDRSSLPQFSMRVDSSPNGTQRNTATIQYQVALGIYGQGNVTDVNAVPEVQPHEKGNFWPIPHPVYNKRTAVVRPQGDVNKMADTAKNPKPRFVARQTARPSHDGKSIISENAPSFVSYNTLRGGSGQSDYMARWNTVKRGAVNRWNQPTSGETASNL